MQSVVSGHDALAVLPSGAGKSAVYQIAGQLADGPVLVVSPLIALQRDQVGRLDELNGLEGRAAQLNSPSRPATSAPRSRARWTERSATSSSLPNS